MDREASIHSAIADHVKRIKAINDKVTAKKKLSKDDLSFLGLEKPEKKEAKAGRPTAGSQALPIYGSMGACVSATGLPLFLIKQAKSEGCEAFRYSRVDLAKLLQHLGKQFANPEKSSSGDDADTVSWRGVFEKYHAMREKDRYHRENQSLIGKEEVRSSMAAGVSELYSTLERVFCNELPPALIGLSEIEIRNRCMSEINQMKEAVRKRFQSLAAAAQPAQPTEELESESSEES